MKTVILAGLDNLVFFAADLLNPARWKLTGFATPIAPAWNIYDENGAVREVIDEIPVMPLDAAVTYEPDCIMLASGNPEDEEKLKYLLFRSDYRGEVVSLYDFFSGVSPRTAAIRKLSWRLSELGIEGATADLGCYRGDISWQMNALMPERKLYLYDTFTGYDSRDVAKELEDGYSDVKANDYSFSAKELENVEQVLLCRMPYPEKVIIRKGWFPESAFAL